MIEPVIIGAATLYCGDWREVASSLPLVDSIIVDPPYSERCHQGHNCGAVSSKGDRLRNVLSYDCLSHEDVDFMAKEYTRLSQGWIVWMSDSDLALKIRTSLEINDRYAFAPLPFYQSGRSVRLCGDGPSSWTDWIMVARTRQLNKWGTLPGGYIAVPGWKDSEYIGGKPTNLMRCLVRDYSRRGQTVLDTHMGSGTTGVASVEAGRKFIGCEIVPKAFDQSCRRIEAAQSQPSLLDDYELTEKFEQMTMAEIS